MVDFSVIPVKTGIQAQKNDTWIPASAGMTKFLNNIFNIFKAVN
jgi:hypothetical protein